MNYSGKFDAKTSADGWGPHSNAHVQVETVHATHAPADAILVEDAHLLFNGQFKRSGVDLVVSKDDRELVLHDYFKGEKRAPLSSPDGAHLSGDVVNALAGNVQYAQADGNASVSKVIGHVSKLVGTATAMRNGVAVVLHNGDNVEKGDVVESGANSTLGITFIDGTVFGLSSNARMVLNEMVYDPNGSSNSSLLSLVAGTITFVAGETAKHGDMKVDTPVATMGIRGTAVLCEIDFTVPGQGTPDAKFQVLVEPDGTTGSYILFDKTTLTPLAVVDRAGTQINISNGIVSQTSAPLSAEVQKLITDVFSLKFSDNSNTRTLDHHTDTLIPQSLSPIQLASGATAIPVIVNLSATPFNSSISTQNGPTIPFNIHIDQAPAIVVSDDAALTAHTGASQATGVDSVSGTVRFTDINAGDLPTVSTTFVSFKLFDAQHNDITSTLTSLQLAQIAAVEAQLAVTPSPGNNNNGSATWTYSVADPAFNFLTTGQTLALTYNAIVNNNFLPDDLTASQSFTIAISGPSNVEWIHPTGGLWSVGSNWSSGAVPTASDDAIIPAQNIPGGTGLYDVTIAAPAFARNLTLNASNTTGGQVINESTLTVGQMLTIFNDGVLNNLGTVTVGKLELFDQSLLENSGLITLGQGGDFTESKAITNSGTIEVAGGTLNVQADIENSGGIINVDVGATMNLNGVAITGGTINGVFAAINITADSSIDGGETDAVLNNGGVTLESGVTLTLDNVAANSTTFADLAGSIVRVDEGNTLALNEAIFNGGTIEDFGTIVVTAASSINGSGTAAILDGGRVIVESEATLTLDNVVVNGTIFTESDPSSTIQVDEGTRLTLNGATFDGGTINDNSVIDVIANSSINGSETDAVLNNGGVTLESGVTLTLDNVTANSTTFTDLAGSIIRVDEGNTLALNEAIFNGGTIEDFGTIIVTAASSINGSGTAAILDGGQVIVESEATLTLDNVVVNGAIFTESDLSSTIQVGEGTRLTLNGATFDGGTINDDAIIDVTADSSIKGGETDAVLNNGDVTIESEVTLKLDDIAVNGTVFTDIDTSSTIQIDAGTTLTLNGVTIDGGTIDDSGTIVVAADSSIDGADANAVLNDGVVTVQGDVTLTLDNVTANMTTFNDIAGGTVRVDEGDVLALNGATVNGGSIADNGAISINSAVTFEGGVAVDGGTISIAKSATLDIENPVTGPGASLNGVNVTNSGTIQVDSDGPGTTTITLLLDGGTEITGGLLLIHVGFPVNTIEGAVEIGTGGAIFGQLTVANNNVLTVDGGDALTLSQVTVNGGTIDNGSVAGIGMIDVVADSSINGVTMDFGDSTFAIDALLNNGGVRVESGVTLTLDNVEVNGTVFTDVDSSSIIRIDDSDALVLSHVAVNGGTINNGTADGAGGTIDVFGDSSINGISASEAGSATGIDAISAGGVAGATINAVLNNGVVTVASEVTLTLDNVTVNGTVFSGADSSSIIQVDDGDAIAFNGATLDGGTLNVFGELVSTGASFITDATIVNSGDIIVSSGTLTIDPSLVTNAGTIQVAGDGTLVLSQEIVTNTGGLIEVDGIDPTNFSTLDLEGTAINGGEIDISGLLVSTGASSINGAAITDTGPIEVIGGTLTVSAATLFDNDSTLEALGAELDLVSTTLTNIGTVEAAGTDGILNLKNATISGGTVLTANSTDVIEATGGLSTISGASSFVNNGTSQALSAELDLVNTTLSNIGTVEAAGTDGILNLKNATISGGTVLTVNSTDVIEATAGVSTISGTSSFVNNGTLETLGAELDLVDTTVTNNGSVVVDLSGGSSGTLDLQDTAIDGGSVSTAASTDVIEATSGVSTISGAESFINNGTLEVLGAELDLVSTTVTNNGSVVVDLSGGSSGALDLRNATIDGGTVLTTSSTDIIEATSGISAISGAGVFVNNGILKALGAELDLVNTTLTNIGTVEAAGTDGILNLKNATISGGTVLTANSTDIIEATSGVSAISGASSFVNNGTSQALSAELDLVNTTLTNIGTVEAAGTAGILNLKNAAISGGAVLTANSTDVIEATAGVSTISGTSSFVNNGTLETLGAELDLVDTTVTNNGSVVVDLSGGSSGTLDLQDTAIDGGLVSTAASTDVIEATSGVSTISSTASFFNFGTVEANDAELDLVNTTVTNNGIVESIGTGILNLKNAAIDGGMLAGPGRIATSAGNITTTLSGVTIAASTLVLAAVGALELTGAITNNGEVDASNGQVDLENANLGGGILGGAGTIATAGTNIDSTLSGVTIASGSTVTAAVGTLDLAGIINNWGQIDAAAGKLELENVTINGGTLGGSGSIVTLGGLNTLNGVTIAHGATVKVTDGTALELAGTTPLSGTIALNSSGDATLLKISGDVLLDGGGQVTLSDSLNNSIVSDGSAATLTNLDVIAGAGTIGDGNLTLVNDGTIDATGTHALIIDTGSNNTHTAAGPVGSLLVTNNSGGILEASAGHTLQIDDNVLNNGLISSNADATVDITGNITGTGSIELFNYAKLEIGGSVSSGQTVTFGLPGGAVSTAATLLLDDSHGFLGTIVGLTENPNESLENHVDLKDLQFTSGMRAHFSGGELTVSNDLGNTVILKVSGNSDSAFELAADGTGGTLIDDPSATGTVTIDSGKTLDISAACSATVCFANSSGSTGELVLDSSKGFTGQIVGFTGDGTTANSDLIDLADVNIADVAANKTTYTDNSDGSGTLTLYNTTGQALDSIKFVGSYQLANFTIENDGTGHTLIVDPPVVSGISGAGGQSPASTIVASAANQSLTGSAASDNFVFNFSAVGHATVTDFHPDVDTLQFKNPVFANAMAVLNAAHDDGHGNAVIAIDDHDVITLSGVAKAQLHATDFHVI